MGYGFLGTVTVFLRSSWQCGCLLPLCAKETLHFYFQTQSWSKLEKKKHCFLKGHVKQDKDREIGSHFLKLMKVSLSAMQHKGRTIHYFMAILRKCWAHSLCSVEQPAQQSRLNNLTFISTCWISLYICFDRKAGNSLFHGQ